MEGFLSSIKKTFIDWMTMCGCWGYPQYPEELEESEESEVEIVFIEDDTTPNTVNNNRNPEDAI